MCVKFVSAALTVVALAAAPVLVSASDNPLPSANGKSAQTAAVEKSTTGFATLKGVKAAPMAPRELDAVKGLHVHFIEPGNGFGKFHLAGNPENKGVGTGNWYDNGSPDGGLVAPSYHGLCKAGPIGIPVMPGHLSQCP